MSKKVKQGLDSSNDDLDESKLFIKKLSIKRSLRNSPTNNKRLRMNEEVQSSSSNDDTQFVCPLCWKTFVNNNQHISHTKLCAKKKKVTTQQLLDALDLHKKQSAERLALGLSVIPNRTSNKLNKKQQPDLTSTYEMSLAVAMSRSLADQTITGEAKTSKPTLDCYGFTSKQASCSGIITGRKRGKCLFNSNTKSLLRDRTQSDRERIMSEKAAIVLLNVEPAIDASVNTSLLPKHCIEVEQSRKQVSQLWNLGTDGVQETWYVKELKEILPQPAASTSLHVSPVSNTDQDTLEEVPETDLYLPQLRSAVADATCEGGAETSQHKSPVNKVNEDKEDGCRGTLVEDWQKLVNNKKLSDMTITTKDQHTVYIHTLVLCCRGVDVDQLHSVLSNYHFNTVVCLLNYLYCDLITDEAEGACGRELSQLASVFKLDKLNKLLADSEKNRQSADTEPVNIDNDIDLTQSSDCSVGGTTEGSDNDQSNIDKSYWSMMEHEKKKQKEEQDMIQEEQEEMKENIAEMQRIEILERRRKEMERRVEEEEIELNEKNKEELEKIRNLNLSLNSNEDNTSDVDLFDVPDDVCNVDCIVLSSSEDEDDRTRVMFDPPAYDQYDDIYLHDELPSAGVDVSSQSLLTGNLKHNHTVTGKKELSASDQTPPRPTSSTADDSKRVSGLSESVLKQLTEDTFVEQTKPNYCSTPITGKQTVQQVQQVEVTPGNQLDYTTRVTPRPDFTLMKTNSLKKRLTKYGLKKSLSKNKAKKILRHIYDELHPVINTRTGKIVKQQQPVAGVTGKFVKQQPVAGVTGKNKKSQVVEEEEDSFTSTRTETSEDEHLDESAMSSQPLTQTTTDLPTAFKNYLHDNAQVHRKILLYEPIWIEDLQTDLLSVSCKKFKLNDIMDYLDKQCITFRSRTQMKNNQRRNERKNKRKKLLRGN